MAAAAAVSAPACTTASKQSGLVLAVTTDLPVPTYVRQVGILVQYADRGRVGQPLHASRYAVRADGTIAIPATLGIGPARSEGDRDLPIRISVVGYRVATSSARAIPSGDTSPPLEAFSIREVQTRIPENDTRLLRMPLEFLDTGSASTTPTPGTGTRSASGDLTTQAAYEVAGVYVNSAEINRPCRPSDEIETTVTAVGGVCAPAVVDPSHLEAYTGPAQIEGGDAHECFDTASCFAGAYVVPLTALRATGAGGLDDPHRCIVDLAKIPGLPADTPKERLNLALDTTRTDEGKTVAGVIPLTHALVTANGAPVAKDLAAIDPGFVYAGRTLEVPGELCEMVAQLPVPYEKRKEATDDRAIERLLVSDRCRAKLAANPACSMNTAGWSSAKITAEAPSDAGVDSGPIDTGPPPPPACKFKEVARIPLDTSRAAAPIYAGGASQSWLFQQKKVNGTLALPSDDAAVTVGAGTVFLPRGASIYSARANDRFAAVEYTIFNPVFSTTARYVATFEAVNSGGMVRPVATTRAPDVLTFVGAGYALGPTRVAVSNDRTLFDVDYTNAASPSSQPWSNPLNLQLFGAAVTPTMVATFCPDDTDLPLCRIPRAGLAAGDLQRVDIPELDGMVGKAVPNLKLLEGSPYADVQYALVTPNSPDSFVIVSATAGAATTTRVDPASYPFDGAAPLGIRVSKAGFSSFWRDPDGLDHLAVYTAPGAPLFSTTADEIQKNIGVSSNDSEVRVAQVVGTDAVVYALPIPCTP